MPTRNSIQARRAPRGAVRGPFAQASHRTAEETATRARRLHARVCRGCVPLPPRRAGGLPAPRVGRTSLPVDRIPVEHSSTGRARAAGLAAVARPPGPTSGCCAADREAGRWVRVAAAVGWANVLYRRGPASLHARTGRGGSLTTCPGRHSIHKLHSLRRVGSQANFRHPCPKATLVWT